MAPLPPLQNKPDADTQLDFASLVRERFIRPTPDSSLAVLEALKQKAFMPLSFPTRKNEAWKYIQLQPLLRADIAPFDQPAVLPDISAHCLADSDGLRMIFVNGAWQPALSDLTRLPAGIEVLPLAEALARYPEAMETALQHSAQLDEDAFAVLNSATLANGLFVRVSEGVTLDRPIQVLFVSQPGAGGAAAQTPAGFIRNVLVAEPKAKACVTMHWVGEGAGAMYFNHVINDVCVGEGADLIIDHVQLESLSAYQFSDYRVSLKKAANLALTHVDLGGHVARHAASVRFAAENAHCTLNGLNVLKGTTEVYHHTVMDHALPNNQSDQFYKSILDDHSRSEFNGTVKVAPLANQTDSRQLNKNLLLSENARAFSRPQLQILADDVKCNHGATVGQLDPEQVFYFESRGIDRELSECLLTYGFAEEIIEKLCSDSLRQYLDNLLLAQLNQAQNPLLCDAACHTCET